MEIASYPNDSVAIASAETGQPNNPIGLPEGVVASSVTSMGAADGLVKESDSAVFSTLTSPKTDAADESSEQTSCADLDYASQIQVTQGSTASSVAPARAPLRCSRDLRPPRRRATAKPDAAAATVASRASTAPAQAQSAEAAVFGSSNSGRVPAAESFACAEKQQGHWFTEQEGPECGKFEGDLASMLEDVRRLGPAHNPTGAGTGLNALASVGGSGELLDYQEAQVFRWSNNSHEVGGSAVQPCLRQTSVSGIDTTRGQGGPYNFPERNDGSFAMKYTPGMSSAPLVLRAADDRLGGYSSTALSSLSEPTVYIPGSTDLPCISDSSTELAFTGYCSQPGSAGQAYELQASSVPMAPSVAMETLGEEYNQQAHLLGETLSHLLEGGSAALIRSALGHSGGQLDMPTINLARHSATLEDARQPSTPAEVSDNLANLCACLQALQAGPPTGDGVDTMAQLMNGAGRSLLPSAIPQPTTEPRNMSTQWSRTSVDNQLDYGGQGLLPLATSSLHHDLAHQLQLAELCSVHELARNDVSNSWGMRPNTTTTDDRLQLQSYSAQGVVTQQSQALAHPSLVEASVQGAWPSVANADEGSRLSEIQRKLGVLRQQYNRGGNPEKARVPGRTTPGSRQDVRPAMPLVSNPHQNNQLSYNNGPFNNTQGEWIGVPRGVAQPTLNSNMACLQAQQPNVSLQASLARGNLRHVWVDHNNTMNNPQMLQLPNNSRLAQSANMSVARGGSAQPVSSIMVSRQMVSSLSGPVLLQNNSGLMLSPGSCDMERMGLPHGYGSNFRR